MTQSRNDADRYAIIAGNGTFPFLVLDAARAEGIEPLVVAIQEEASPDLSSKGADTRWVSLGEVSKFFELLKSERVNKVVLAGQVKHAQLFSNIKPDGLLNRALAGLTRKNTDALIGAFVHMLSRQGIE
ncbi:MAG: LpxI family protein, partial [Deltaproteobacteria bacterium]